jgi:hypothetical protein
MPGASFYGNAQQYADGASSVAPIGSAAGQGQAAYGPPVQLSAPEILNHLANAGKQTGLSPNQIAGLSKALQGLMQGYNQMAPGGAADMATAPTGAGYQAGISDIGYAPGIAPGAVYHGDRGGWLGGYDPAFMIPQYARGTSSVPSRFFR